MLQIAPKTMNCQYCQGFCIKKGFYKKTQGYQCKNCKKYMQGVYTNGKCSEEKDAMIIKLNNEGNGVSSISRIVELSKTSIIRRIRILAQNAVKPVFTESNQTYELDELCTYTCKNNPSNHEYIIYAINRKTRQIIDICIGKRTSENIAQVVNAVLELNPKRIYTDKLNSYPTLIPKHMHKPGRYVTNKIERMNLTLRTHLKRLSRKTICFSKKIDMLRGSLLLYWKYKKSFV